MKQTKTEYRKPLDHAGIWEIKFNWSFSFFPYLHMGVWRTTKWKRKYICTENCQEVDLTKPQAIKNTEQMNWLLKRGLGTEWGKEYIINKIRLKDMGLFLLKKRKKRMMK